jgi:hypothetical protein
MQRARKWLGAQEFVHQVSREKCREKDKAGRDFEEKANQ